MRIANTHYSKMLTRNPLNLIIIMATTSFAPTPASAAETHITGYKFAVPTKNNDPPSCGLEYMYDYLTKGPSPTPTALADALFSHEASLYKPCTDDAAREAMTPWEPCPVPPRSDLCKFASVVPTTLLGAYSAYASSAAAWWSAGNGDQAVRLDRDCPYLWYDSLMRNPGTGVNLNRTVAHAQCYAEANPTGGSGLSSSSRGTGMGTAQSGSTPTPTPTETGRGTSFGRRVDALDTWMVAGSGMTIAVFGNAGFLCSRGYTWAT